VKLLLSGSVMLKSDGARVTVCPSLSVSVAPVTTGGVLDALKVIVAASVFESTVPSFILTLKLGAIALPSSTNCTRLPVRSALVNVVIACRRHSKAGSSRQ